MNTDLVRLNCKDCHEDFQPDLKTTCDWFCPHCKAKNPNLIRHYRSVADLYVLSLFFLVMILVWHVLSVGWDLDFFLSLPMIILLGIAIVVIYKSKTPWIDKKVRHFIWLVFGVSFVFKLFQTVLLLLAGALYFSFVASFLVIYSFIFFYLLWLELRSRKYRQPTVT